jgi:hypothetical protein
MGITGAVQSALGALPGILRNRALVSWACSCLLLYAEREHQY